MFTGTNLLNQTLLLLEDSTRRDERDAWEDRSSRMEAKRIEKIRSKARSREGNSTFSATLRNEGMKVTEIDISDLTKCDCCSESDSPRERFIRHFSSN